MRQPGFLPNANNVFYPFHYSLFYSLFIGSFSKKLFHQKRFVEIDGHSKHIRMLLVVDPSLCAPSNAFIGEISLSFIVRIYHSY